MTDTHIVEEIDKALVDKIVAFLILNTPGPSNAYAAIACVLNELLRLNKESTGEEISIEQIGAEIITTLRSIHLTTDTLQ